MILFYFTAKNNFKLPLLKLLYKPLIAGIVMGVIIFSLKFLHIFFLVPVAMIVYFSVLLLIKGFGKEEMNLIKSFRS